MVQAVISYKASVTVGGESREIAGSEAVDVQNVITGSQTIGTTYEVLQGVSMSNVGMVFYNPSEVDVSIRISVFNFSVNEYIFYNLVAGGILVIQPLHRTDTDHTENGETLYARTASGTATIEYCHLS